MIGLIAGARRSGKCGTGLPFLLLLEAQGKSAVRTASSVQTLCRGSFLLEFLDEGYEASGFGGIFSENWPAFSSMSTKYAVCPNHLCDSGIFRVSAPDTICKIYINCPPVLLFMSFQELHTG